jgi:hypothetical protein
MRDARLGFGRQGPEVGRSHEIEPILQSAGRHANEHVVGWVIQNHTPSAELIVDRELPNAAGVQKRYP